MQMRDGQHRFLMLIGHLPARLTAEQATWVLNCQPHDVPLLSLAAVRFWQVPFRLCNVVPSRYSHRAELSRAKRFCQHYERAFAPSKIDVAKVLMSEPDRELALIWVEPRRLDSERLLAN